MTKRAQNQNNSHTYDLNPKWIENKIYGSSGFLALLLLEFAYVNTLGCLAYCL